MLLYNAQVSGNCYKARLLLAHLGVDYERREIDVIDRGGPHYSRVAWMYLDSTSSRYAPPGVR